MRACFYHWKNITLTLFTGLLLGFSAIGHSTIDSNQPINVNVVSAMALTKQRTLEFSGSIEAKQRAQISTLEAGIVDSLYVEVGDYVEQGHVLLKLDKRLASLAVDAAKASLQAAKVSLSEAQRLYKEVLALSENQVVPQTLILERAALQSGAEATFAREQANLALQQELLDRHTLRAPFAGVIAMRSTEVGEWLNVQAPAFELVNNKDLRVNVLISQQYYNDLLSRDKIAVTILADSGGSPIQTHISRIVPVSNRANRSILAQIDLPPSSGLIAGMSARAKISMGDNGGREIKLPRSAIKQHPDGGSSVFVVNNGIAKRLIVDYWSTENGNVGVLLDDPALANSQFIVSAIELLKDGDKVQVNAIDNGITR